MECKWKEDFQKLCKKYGVDGCNKGTLYYTISGEVREHLQDGDLKRLFVYALCDDGFWADKYIAYDEQEMQISFRRTEQRIRKLFSLLQKEKALALQWKDIVNRKSFPFENVQRASEYDEELITLCSLFRDTFEMSEKQSPNLADNLHFLLLETRSSDELGKITPFYLFQIMVRHTNRLAQNPDFQAALPGLWKYKEYEIEKNNGKNFTRYERYIRLFQRLCKYYKKDPRVDVLLCRYGMEQCSNLSEWTGLWFRKKEKKCITKLHRFVNDFCISCMEPGKPQEFSVCKLFPHRESEEEALFLHDLEEKLESAYGIKQYVLDNIEILIQFMKCHYENAEQLRCMIAKITHVCGFDAKEIEGVSEETKLTYVYEQLIEMLDDAIASSVWQTVKAMVICDTDHFNFIAAILS